MLEQNLELSEQIYLHKALFQNYRNLPDIPFEFNNSINCLYGANGSGKTSVIEAIYYFLHKKSFRKNTRFPQILNVNCGKPEILFQTSFIDNNKNLTGYSRKFTEHGMGKLNSPFKKKLSCFVINPLDSLLFNLKAEARRDFFDQNLSLISDSYKKHLKTYTRLVKQKNKLLHDYNPSVKSIIMILNQEISNLSFEITQERIKWVNSLNQLLTKNYFELFSIKHLLRFELDSKFSKFSTQDFVNYYTDRHEREIMLKRHYSGVHLDDYCFYFDDMISYEFCSLGQQKMSYLALFFAFISLYQQTLSSFPLVMIDDISSELDSERWKNLINFLKTKKFQVILTTANENFFQILKNSSDINEIFLSENDENAHLLH
ncbi:DNA replication and repair protein RecF [Bacteriovoracaceae bacterium]|nr:DNA replication and repair protein RecF [Bacteriovoracaceae bacterium]